MWNIERAFDGTDCRDLEWKLHESTFGSSLVEQCSNEQRIASSGAGISGHLHNDHGIGVARFDQKLDSTETGMETGRLLCWLRFAMRTLLLRK